MVDVKSLKWLHHRVAFLVPVIQAHLLRTLFAQQEPYQNAGLTGPPTSGGT